MSAQEAHGHAEGGNRLYLSVWVGLLILTGVEVFLAYERLDRKSVV